MMNTEIRHKPLDCIFRPRSVAVIGASERAGSVGRAICQNLLSGGFGGSIQFVNPKHRAVFGHKCFAEPSELAEPPDLAVLATPARTISAVTAVLGEIGTRSAVILTAGTKEDVDQDALARTAARFAMRIIGPNSVGVLSPHVGLNGSFAHLSPMSGKLALLSQSGAILTSLLDWAVARRIGFSAMVSTGNSVDVDFDELLDYFAADGKTSAILLYAESIHKTAAFMSAARRASRVKPVIVMKVGRRAEGMRAALSHTGALAGSDAVYDAAFRRAGLVRVFSLEDLFDAAGILSIQPAHAAERLAIVTNGGGAGVIAADRLADIGGRLADLSPSAVGLLDRALPPTWSHVNPVDIVGDADSRRYQDAVDAVIDDPQNDAVLVIRCPTSIASADETARAVIETVASVRRSSSNRKPVLTCWLGEETADAARSLFEAAKLPTFESPEDAVQAAAHLTAYAKAQETIMRMPGATDQNFPVGKPAAAQLIGTAQRSGRTILTEAEAKQLLSAYGIPTVPTHVARTPDDAESIAAAILGERDGPDALVLKVVSPEISHKSDVGGVRLNLRSADAVRRAAGEILDAAASHVPEAELEGVAVEPMIRRVDAQELIVGIARDAAFGPVVLFGAGGTAVEILDDKAVDLPPLDDLLAKAMISRTRVSKLLAGYRQHPPANTDAVAETLIRVARLASDFPELVELDINPLLADKNGVIALDARAVIARHGEAVAKDGEHLAIAPYPDKWELESADSSGARMIIRPILPTDEALCPAFFERVEPRDIRLRLFASRCHFGHQDFARWAQIDYRREMTFVAIGQPGGELLGIVQLSQPDDGSAEFAILVRSDVQGHGIGFSLMQQIIAFGRWKGLSSIYGEILPENACMRSLCQALGFNESTPSEDGIVKARLTFR